MSKSDELDPRLSAAFAWRTTPPDEATAATPEPAPPAPVDLEALREQAHRECAELADRVDRVWALPEAGRLDAVSALLLRAGEMGVSTTGMIYFPEAALRFYQLALQCWAELSEEARTGAARAVVWADLTRPELAQLLADAAATHPTFGQALLIALALDVPSKAAFARSAGAGRRFARMLAEAQGSAARELALRCIDVCPHPDAVTPLRHALTLEKYRVRSLALYVLDRHFPAAIQPDDVRALLADLVAHAPPRRNGEDGTLRAPIHRRLAPLLRKHLVALRPEGALPLLQRLVRGEDEDENDDDDDLPRISAIDDRWAIHTLAEAYPEEALRLCDAQARSADPWLRGLAVEGAAGLPDELAWPRLLAAAADPSPENAARAQAIWLERRDETCPLDELAGLLTELLAGPPSERMRSRLAVLRRGPHEARGAMVEVLLDEGPDPESLVCLLFAMGDSGLWDHECRPRVPTGWNDFASALHHGFGEPAVVGIATLAGRYDDQDRFEAGGFLGAVASFFEQGVAVPRRLHESLRASAGRRIAGDVPESPHDETTSLCAAARVLAHVGAPRALASRLGALAWGPLPESPWGSDEVLTLRTLAGTALAATPADEEIDALIVAELRAARAAGDVERFSWAAIPGGLRRIEAVMAEIEAVFREHWAAPEGDPAILPILDKCRVLLSPDRLPPTWAEDALASPGTQGFIVTARRLRQGTLSEAARAALTAALAGPPIAAAEAALTLLDKDALDAAAPRVFAVIERAPLHLRSELLARLLTRQVDVRALWPHLEQILVSSDPSVIRPFQLAVYLLKGTELEEKAVALRGRIQDPSFQAVFPEPSPEEEDPEDREQSEAEKKAFFERLDAMIAARAARQR
jgi:hypothetical protein